MAEWVSHLIVADRVLERLPKLCKHEFCVGNIAPDCNMPNEDGTDFIPPRKVTHWITGERKTASDMRAFYDEYVLNRWDSIESREEFSFLLGYYSHLITDAELQRTIRDEERVAAAWARAKAIPELSEKSAGMKEDWDSFKKLYSDRKDRQKDFYVIEREYLDKHPASGYFTELKDIKEFPDYIDYLPDNAIALKVPMMYYMPTLEEGQYPFVAFSREEYEGFLDRAVELVVDAIKPEVDKFFIAHS